MTVRDTRDQRSLTSTAPCRPSGHRVLGAERTEQRPHEQGRVWAQIGACCINRGRIGAGADRESRPRQGQHLRRSRQGEDSGPGPLPRRHEVGTPELPIRACGIPTELSSRPPRPVRKPESATGKASGVADQDDHRHSVPRHLDGVEVSCRRLFSPPQLTSGAGLSIKQRCAPDRMPAGSTPGSCPDC
jgi:hypothetical protein